MPVGVFLVKYITNQAESVIFYFLFCSVFSKDLLFELFCDHNSCRFVFFEGCRQSADIVTIKVESSIFFFCSGPYFQQTPITNYFYALLPCR